MYRKYHKFTVSLNGWKNGLWRCFRAYPFDRRNGRM